MSTVNEEEINELNDTVKEEVENDIVPEVATEQETEPMDIMVEEENEVVIENKESVEEVMNDEEPEPITIEENEKEQVMDTENIDEPAQVTQEEDVQDIMNVDKQDEMNDIAPADVEEEKEQEPISSRKGSTNKINSRKSSQSAVQKSSKQSSAQNLDNNTNDSGKGMIDKAFTEPASEQNEMRIYNGPIYCIEQVRIPPELPDIMKNYAKHIIRTQPDDVLIESYEYFKKLNKLRNSSSIDDEYGDDKSKNNFHMSFTKGENHSEILENSNFSINSENQENKDKKLIQLSPLELESFYERLLDFSDGNDIIPVADIRTMAEDANISQSQVNEAIVVGSWDNDIDWLKFWALIVAGSCTNLMSTLKVIIDIIGDENIIPLKKATNIIEFLLDSDPNSNENVVKDVITTLNERDGEVIEKEELNSILSVLKN